MMVRRGVRDRLLQDAHRFHDGDRAGAVVQRAGRTVPGVVVAAEDHIFKFGCAWGFGCAWRFGGAGDLGDGVEDRHLTEEAGLGVHAQHRLLTVLGQPVHQPV